MTGDVAQQKSRMEGASASLASSRWGFFAPTLLQRVVLALAHHTLLGRGSGRRITTKALLALRSAPIDFTLDGSPYRFDIRDNSTDRQSLLRPRYNAEEFEFLVGRVGADPVFVDIGANSGFFCVKIAKRYGATGRVLAIEPNPQILPRLRLNVAPFAEKITLLETAVGRSDGVARFHSSEGNLGQSSFSENGEIEVPVRPLLALLQEQGVSAIDALKIDVEGFEDDVLVPFLMDAPAELLPKRVVIEFTSQKHWKEDCLALLRAKGYLEIKRTRGNSLLELGG